MSKEWDQDSIPQCLIRVTTASRKMTTITIRDVLAQSDQALAGEGPWPRAVQALLQIWPLSSNCLHGCRLNLILLIGKSERFVLDNHFYCFNIKQFNDFKKIHTSIIIATLGMFSENE